jgi:hypothetical protein
VSRSDKPECEQRASGEPSADVIWWLVMRDSYEDFSFGDVRLDRRFAKLRGW